MSPCKSKIYKGFLFMGVFNSPGTHTNRPDRLGGLDPKPSQIPGVVHTDVPVMPTNVKTARITGRRFQFEDIVDIANALVQWLERPNRSQNGSGDLYSAPSLRRNDFLMSDCSERVRT